MIFFASCGVLEDGGKRSVVYLQVDNTENCTDVVIVNIRTGEVITQLFQKVAETGEPIRNVFD
jgi:hypothetical protein